MNKNTVFEAVEKFSQKATKLELINIIFPMWDELGMLGQVFRQMVRTKENPEGQIYPEATYRTVMRVLGGKVYMTNGMADAYAWSQATFEKKAKNIQLIGCNSGAGVLNLATLLGTISNDKERLDVADMFSKLKTDLMLVRTCSEERTVVEITQDLYDMGITSCIDEWQEADAEGNYTVTALNVGDFLVLNPENHTVYCVRRAEFLETHKLG